MAEVTGSMIKVSVVVPIYNTEKYLSRCLDALVNQTLEEIEIIAVNDGSTDGSLSVLKQYETIYPKKIKVCSTKNKGQGAARNLGMQKSSGEYIGFADSDDFIDKTMFEKMYRLAKERSCDMVECCFNYQMEKAGKVKELSPRGNVREYQTQKDMFIDPQVSPWNKIFRREVIHDPGINFPEGKIYEDTAFYLKVIPNIKTSAYLDEPLVFYFLHPGSTINANRSRKVSDIFAVLQDVLVFYKERGLAQTYWTELEYCCVKILLCSSLSRIGRIPDRTLKSRLLDRTFEFIHETFPNYRRNPYFKGKIGIYIKNVNRKNGKWIGQALGRILKG